MDYDWHGTKDWIPVLDGIDYRPDGSLRIYGYQYDLYGEKGHDGVEMDLLVIDDDIKAKYPSFDGRIRNLYIHNVGSLNNLSFLRFFLGLKVLYIYKCFNLNPSVVFDRDYDMPELEEVRIAKSQRNICFGYLPSAHTIKKLTLRKCAYIRADGYPNGFPNLKTLVLDSCWEIPDLMGFHCFYNLESLQIIGSRDFCSLQKGHTYPKLKELVVAPCLVKDLSPIKKNLPHLKRLKLIEASRLTHLNDLKGMESLEEFVAVDCPNLIDTSALSTMPSLTHHHID